ncbi:MAG: glucose-fructose oxidoreductase, partial [Chitinophagaceae bacterium]|nr:glucose-fructose oxidoreductase [Chitinophagaceae bacterium]
MNSRRDFLQKIAAASIVVPFLPKTVEASAEKYEGPVLRVAILGLGSYGTRVADAMQSCKKAKLVGAISGTPSKLKDWQSKYNIPEKNCYNYENFDQVKNNPEIDAVYVITPNALHKEFVIRAAKAGKQVICEKPMSVNAKDGQEMVDA